MRVRGGNRLLRLGWILGFNLLPCWDKIGWEGPVMVMPMSMLGE